MTLIPASHITTFSRIAEQFIESLGQNCVLVYPETQSKCPNCTNGYTYNGSGPISFPADSVCPYCQGLDYVVTETKETVRCMVYTEPKNFVGIGKTDIQIPGEMLQIRALLSIYPKVDRAQEIIVSLETLGFGEVRYIKYGSMLPFGMNEFIQTFKRVK